MKIKDISSIKDLIEVILTENTAARNSDNYLYYMVLKHVAAEKGIDLLSMTVPTFLIQMKQYGFPGFETVRRARQKLQAEQPELSAVGTVEEERMANEEIFRVFARS